MSLATADDARRVLLLSHAEYDRLLSYLEQLAAEGWTEQSACRDWKVYQVVSHIGSQPAIHGGALKASLRNAEPMTDEQRRTIWGYFDGLQPLEVLPAFRKTNDEFFELADSLDADELGRRVAWFIGEVPVATILAGRLNEQVLHHWDIRWARDREARLSAAALPDILDFNLQPAFLARSAKTERAPRLHGTTVGFVLRDPGDAATIRVQTDGVEGSRGRTERPDLTVELPTEAFVRLLWGRYDVEAGRRSGELKLDRPELAEALQALFPGR